MKRLLKALFLFAAISAVAAYLWYRWHGREPASEWRPIDDGEPPAPQPGTVEPVVTDAGAAAVATVDIEADDTPLAPDAVFTTAESELQQMEAEDRLMEAILPLAEDEAAIEETPAALADEAPAAEQEATAPPFLPAEPDAPWPWQRREARAEPAAEPEPEASATEGPTAPEAAEESSAEADRWLWPWQRREVPEPPAEAPEAPADVPEAIDVEETAAAEETPAAEAEAPATAGEPAQPDVEPEPPAPEEPEKHDDVVAPPLTLVPDDLVTEADRPSGETLFDEGLAEERSGPEGVSGTGFELPWQRDAALDTTEAEADGSGLTLVPEDVLKEAERLDEQPQPFDETQTPAPPAEPPAKSGGFRWPWQRAAEEKPEPVAEAQPQAAEAPAEPPAPADTGFRWPWQRRDQPWTAAVSELAADETEAPIAPADEDLPVAETPLAPEAALEPISDMSAEPETVETMPEPAAPEPVMEAEPPAPAAVEEPAPPTRDTLSGVLDKALDDVRPEPVAPHTGRSAESFLDEGNVYFNVGQYGLAIERYTHAVEIDPNLTAGYYNRANARTRAGEYEYALADYDRALELEPNDADALNNRGMLHLYRANYGAALRDFNTALTIDPSDTTVIVNRGLAHLHGGDAAAALVDFQEAAALDDNDAAAHYGAGQAAAALSNRDEALRRLRRALQLDPAYAREAAADPKLAALQGDADFLRILRDAGGRR